MSVFTCVALLGALLLSPPAALALTTFGFDDFPAQTDLSPPGDFQAWRAEIGTTLYGCDGKSFCTNGDLLDARSPNVRSISTSVDGIQGVFSRPGGLTLAPFSEFIEPGVTNQFLTAGDAGPTDYTAYVATFSAASTFAQVEVSQPFAALPDLPEFGADVVSEVAFLELWSDPDATGTQLGRVEVPGSRSSDRPMFLPLTSTAPGSATFRSIRFGLGLDFPGCESGCYGASFGVSGPRDLQGVADRVRVLPVPEPSSTVLFASGLVSALAAGRTKPSGRSKVT